MEQLSHGNSESVAELGDQVERSARRPDAEALPSIETALRRAGSTATAESDTTRLDRAVVRGLLARKGPDGLLARLPLDALAELAGRCSARLPTDVPVEFSDDRQLCWELLDLLRRPAFLKRIERADIDDWAGRILQLVERSHFTVGPLFRQRVATYGSKTLFEPGQEQGRGWSWRRVSGRVEFLGRALSALDESDRPAPIAILSENRIEVALLDLACLSSGLVNVMVPANATDADVEYILRHSGSGSVIVSGQNQLDKVLKAREGLTGLRRIVTLDRLPGADLLALDDLGSLTEGVSRDLPRERSERVRINDLATVMYTSGTTGTPKAIQFSHRNIVFKRFARALALPEIGDTDVFLSFLPLYHTFGRFLEMMGCVFWGATYCFLESASLDGLALGMRRHRPTVFISVPKKWTQLHELIAQQADPVEAPDAQIAAAVRRVTGGRLRWGLSAAGHLDSDIFRFFQRHGVNLMSGFGMTEATGGITMTPPGEYVDGSLGTALPGIEVRLADDGEMLVRGPYVMIGYLAPPDGETAFDEDGWFPTGDLMETTDEGHLRLVDRKKEIYKNTKGETIAPQRVENLLRELDSVGRAFLVGDHREYNTLLIYPNPDYTELDLGSLSSQEVMDHFRSLVVSVNKFLAPYESIVDFALMPRDLDAARGELTPKGTLRRKAIERNFLDIIRTLYRRANIHVGGIDLVIPNWLFQILGLTARDIRFGEENVTLPSSGARLTVRSVSEGLTQIGSCVYRHEPGPLDLGTLLTTPRLWLGNEELVSFVQLDTVTRRRSRYKQRGVEWADRLSQYTPREDDHATLKSFLGRDDLDLFDLDLAGRMMVSPYEVDALLAIRVFEEILERDSAERAEPARLLLARASRTDAGEVRRRAFQVLVPHERNSRFENVARQFIDCDADLLDAETRLRVSEVTLSRTKIKAILKITRDACLAEGDAETTRRAGNLLALLSTYGAVHPVSYRLLRAFLERMDLEARHAEVALRARKATGELLEGFRRWMGPAAQVAVDAEKGREYHWEDVVAFDDAVPAEDRRRLLSALKRTAFLGEAVFLFSHGVSLRLSDIVPRGVRVRLLGSLHGKSVYRLTVQSRFQGSFDLAANLNHALTPEEVKEEIHWLIVSGDPGSRRAPLVEEFGGYWPDQDLWSEEFIAGETLDRAMRRLSRRSDEGGRLRRLWPFMAWATLSAYVDFWNRSGRRQEIADPNMTNIIVPTQDFLSGVRIVSVSRRRPHRGLLAMLRGFRDEFLTPAEEQHPVLAGVMGWPVVFSSVLEVVGEVKGLEMLRTEIERAGLGPDLDFAESWKRYAREVEARGFIPMRLHFAAERYRRWAKLSKDATPQARALTLRELFETYGLQRLSESYPEIRVRFFRETVFEDCPPTLGDGLMRIIRKIRDGELAADELIDAIDILRAETPLSDDDEYFLARLSYPHLRPQDDAVFVRTDFGGKRQSEIVVTLHDSDNHPFRVRHALNPKEVERLFRLFLAARLDVRFRTEHHFLVAINDRGHIIGGIYYETDEEGSNTHLEKIVVADRYRQKSIADGLMKELINRLGSAGVKTLTTGFFLPDFFYRYGFSVGKRFAGLVRSLEERDLT